MNAKQDIVFKRCGCTDEDTGRQLAGRCVHLAESGHGSSYYAVQVTTVGGRRARYRRGGFATREAAVTARQAILDGPAGQAAAGAWTVARWLRYWLTQAEPHLRPSTLHGYRDHIDRYLIPSLGRITLADLIKAARSAPGSRPGGRADRAPCATGCHCLRLLPDVSSRSSAALWTGLAELTWGRSATSRSAST
jgi:Phage integrase, N-terminal SAM-like domain